MSNEIGMPATGLVRGLTFVTRDTGDFVGFEGEIVDPCRHA